MRPSALLLLTRRPALGTPPFQELQPLKLKTRVAGKGQGRKVPGCLQEMSVLFACLSNHEFQESSCAPEIAAFQSCYTADTTNKYMKKKQRLTGNLEPNQKHLEREQANQLLAKYPPYYEHKSKG